MRAWISQASLIRSTSTSYLLYSSSAGMTINVIFQIFKVNINA